MRRGAASAAPEAQPPSQALAEIAPPEAVTAEALRRGEVWGLLRSLQVSVVVNLFLCGLIWMCVIVAGNRPMLAVTGGEDLRSRMAQHLNSEGLKSTQLAGFLHKTLTLKHSVTSEGAPFLPLLQGTMSSHLYDQAVDTINRNLGQVRAQGMAQTLVLHSVTDVDYDESARRVAAVVSGTFYVQAATTKRGGALANQVPYRASVVLEVLPISNVNTEGFYLVEMREAIGVAETEQFEKDQNERRKKLSGTSTR